jgi:hypothetical protein
MMVQTPGALADDSQYPGGSSCRNAGITRNRANRRGSRIENPFTDPGARVGVLEFHERERVWQAEQSQSA